MDHSPAARMLLLRAHQVLRMDIDDDDLVVLADARSRLENPSLVIRLSSTVGMPVETVTRELSKRAPKVVVKVVGDSTQKAIEYALKSSIWTLKESDQVAARPGLHKAAAMTTGAVAGFFGLETLVIELPLTTGIIFRSIADIARAEGESPSDPETILNCMQVFAMGSGMSNKDDAAETSYYGVRVALSKAVSDAVQYVASHSAGSVSAPALVRLISALASRFGVVVTQKAMAQSIPLIGALGGGLVNTLFISHFQDMARGHFAIRRLERKYGAEVVQQSYIGFEQG